ncbi:homoserine kinase [Alloalcanivorax sp. C16-1]|uniref:homoserine kinase n=1 Tax=Alloalcanivorax sp. C16-1 TaxID=3390051 RepID=UPI003970E644
MSVYTRLDDSELASLLDEYDLRLESAQAAPHGIENSTWLIQARDRYQYPRAVVLTVFERFSEATLSPYLTLLSTLAQGGLPVPAPLLDRAGRSLRKVAGKPAVLVPRLPGQHCFRPDSEHCRQVGALLAALHRQPSAPARTLPDERARLAGFAEHLCRLGDDDRRHARRLLQHWRKVPPGEVLIHGDLFRDNALFNDSGRLTGVLDFYNACLERPEYDLAVALNDWAVSAEGRPVPRREAALLAGYREADGVYEPAVLELALAVAALRFWLSRLIGPVSGDAEGQGSKDPAEYSRIFGYRFEALSQRYDV